MKVSFILKLITASVLVIIISFAVLTISNQNEREAVSTQATFKQLGLDLSGASDFLTNQARAYVQYGEKKYRDDYIKEVETTKTRERVVAELKRLGAPHNEIALVEKALELSNTLAELEKSAFEAVERGDMETARQIIFGADYENGKAPIISTMQEFQSAMNSRTSAAAESAKSRADMMLIVFSVLFTATAVVITTALVSLNKKTKRIAKLAGCASRIASGDTDVQIETESEDEIGVLSDSFRTMLGAVQQQVITVQRLVEERTAELALQTSTLTTIFDSIPDIVFCKGMDLNYTRCNKSFERFFNCREQDVIGLNERQTFELPLETISYLRESELKVIQGKRLIQTEEEVPSANGTVQLFDTVRVPLINNGEPVGIIGIARDITRRKAAEETLKLTLDNIDSCICITEIDTGKILFINDRMISEYGVEDYNGEPCWEVLYNSSQRCEFCPLPSLSENGGRDIIWEDYNKRTGKHYKNTDSLIKWHDGRMVHMRHSVDITDLIKLQRELESASRAKGDFLSRMSHEIRTPMNAIIGMAKIADNTDDIERIRYCLDTIKTSSDHLLGLINDILDMSKIEAGKLELESAPFNLEKTLMKISNIIIDRTEAKRQRLNIIFEPHMHLHYSGDELRLSQVITNLLSNAVKFTPEEGSITVKLDTVKSDGDLCVMRVSVRDTGIGMTREQIGKLFTSFSQADDSITRRFGGTGLGLAIAKSIVEKMNGRIWVESEPEKGSAFIFDVELVRAQKQGAARLNDGIIPSDTRLLIICGDADTRRQFVEVVRSLGMHADEAESGKAGLDALERIAAAHGAYDVIFLDYHLPDIEGEEMMRRLGALIGQSAAVVMTTFTEWTEIEKAARSYGLSRYILKPLFPSSILDTINEAAGKGIDAADIGAVTDAPKSDFSGINILLAEDMEINQIIFTTLMEETDVAIDIADNGREVVKMFESAPDKYDMILMDVQMPEMNGLEATKIIRASYVPRAETIPIIAMTANAFKEDIDQCLACGMNDHLAKPIDIDAVFEKIRHYHTAANRS